MYLRKKNQSMEKRSKTPVTMVVAVAMAGLMVCTVYAGNSVVLAGGNAGEYGPGYVQNVMGGSAADVAGWQYRNENWYFYHEFDGSLGMQAGGWLWVDGYCYYFYKDGRMAAACMTPDGYTVSGSGAWMENGVAVYVLGNGISTQALGLSEGGGHELGTRIAGGGAGGGSGSPGGGSGSPGGGSGSPGGGSGSPGGGGGSSGGGSGSPGGGSGSPGGGSGSPGGGSGSPGGGSGSPGGGSGSSGGGSEGSGDGSGSSSSGSDDPGGEDIVDQGDGDKYPADFPDDPNSEEEPEHSLQMRLEYWQNRAREADLEITGIDNALDRSYLIEDKNANDHRMKNLVSMISDWKPHEFYMIGVDYRADTLILGQVFREQIIYSNTVEDSFDINGVSYTISRIGIQKIQNNAQGDIEDGTITDGTEEGEEDHPSVGMHYSYGDVVKRQIGGQNYRFRCIDEDYRDASGNYRGVALFLCDTVIRSDVNGYEDIIKFGDDNNYKKSDVREWLGRHASDGGFPEHPVSIAISNACTGSTEPDCWEQVDADELRSYPLERQKLNDGIFLLSVEEAMEYAKELWRFNGSDSNNAEDQYSPWSKGYYLRTPQYEENESGEFYYGDHIYIVDLMEGNIHATDVSYPTIGLRPAFVLANG